MFRIRAKTKSPLGELCASGLGFPKIAFGYPCSPADTLIAW
jgi:hypothetical protein